MLCGGSSEEKQATAEIQSICDQVKGHVQTKTGKEYDEFNAKKYTTQVVAGTNFFIKVHLGGDDHLHIRVFRPLPHTNNPLEVHGVQENKTHNEPIVYF